jgi:predicted DNA-binding transcriptional regulator AlpA
MPSSTLPFEDTALVFPADLAQFLSVSPSTLERWRCRGGGPPFLKVGRRRIAYRAGSVRRWLEAQERDHNAA